MSIKIGDKVRVVAEISRLNGCEGVVKYISDGGGMCAVEFSELPFIGHNCNGCTKSGKGQWVFSSSLKLIEEVPKEFKVIVESKGDITTAKLIHGKRVEKEVSVKRYYKDNYDESQAVRYVSEKLFANTPKAQDTKKLLNGKYLNIDMLFGFTKHKVYTFENGSTHDNDGDKRPYNTSPATIDSPWAKHWICIVE